MKYSLMKREYEYWEEKAATIARKNKKSSFVKAVNDFFTPKISQAKGE